MVHIEEKPEHPASDFCVTGIYCYEAGVFDIIGDLVPSGRGELEITDVNNHYVAKGQMAHDVQEGFWGDGGSRSRRTTPSTTSSGRTGPTAPDRP